MKLHLLGTTGYHPNERRHTACLMLPELGIVLDAGTAMFRVRDLICTSTLDIFVTHAHLDHIVGLTYLLDVVHGKDLERITLHGAAETLTAIDEHLFAEPLFPVKPHCEFRPLRGPVDLAGGGRLTAFPLEHPGGSLGFRLDWREGSLAYVTDTSARVDADYVRAIQGVDLLVHECNFPDAKALLADMTGHSILSQVAEVAKAAGVGRLILTHVDPLADAAQPLDLAPARALFANVQLGEDRLEVDF